jgi:hypothetical protein
VGQLQTGVALDWKTGGLWGVGIVGSNLGLLYTSFTVETYIDSARKLNTRLSVVGRPAVCSPSGSTMTEPACP